MNILVILFFFFYFGLQNLVDFDVAIKCELSSMMRPATATDTQTQGQTCILSDSTETNWFLWPYITSLTCAGTSLRKEEGCRTLPDTAAENKPIALIRWEAQRPLGEEAGWENQADWRFQHLFHRFSACCYFNPLLLRSWFCWWDFFKWCFLIFSLISLRRSCENCLFL